MILLLAIITLLFTGILLIIYKDIRKPPILLAAEFTIIYFLEYFIGYHIYSEDWMYGYFFLGLLSFSIGYYLFGRLPVIYIKRKVKSVKGYFYNIKLINLFLIIFDVCCMYEILRMYGFAKQNYVDNFFTTIHRLYRPTLLFGRLRLCIYAVSVNSALIYFKFEKNHKTAFIFLHSFCLAIISAVMSTGRAQVLFPAISIIIIWLYSEPQINIKKVFGIFGGIVLFMAFFLYTSILKYSNLTGENLIEFISDQIKIYLCSSMPAFIHWTKQPIEYLYGQNSFRFIYALLGIDDKVVTIVQNFISIEDLTTNVYTIYQYYASDFGLIYAIFIQFFIGGFYNILFHYAEYYKNRHRNCFLFWGLYSLLFYPLAMQYGGDSYMALLSTWIQLTFWLWVFSRDWVIKEIKNE